MIPRYEVKSEHDGFSQVSKITDVPLLENNKTFIKPFQTKLYLISQDILTKEETCSCIFVIIRKCKFLLDPKLQFTFPTLILYFKDFETSSFLHVFYLTPLLFFIYSRIIKSIQNIRKYLVITVAILFLYRKK